MPFCHLEFRAKKPQSAAYPAELKTYGDHLRARRLELGLLQRQVGDEIAVDECSIYNWENNRAVPAVRVIPKIIQFLSYCPYTPGLPISGQLTLWRHSLGLSQEEIAKRIGVDHTTLRRWETGRRQPAPKYVGRIKAFIDSIEIPASKCL